MESRLLTKVETDTRSDMCETKPGEGDTSPQATGSTSNELPQDGQFLNPMDTIHSRVRAMFILLTLLSVLILITLGVRIVSSEKIIYIDLGWMGLFGAATIALTFAEIGCLRYIQNGARPRMEELVMQDELTGLFNRRYIYERIDEEISRSRRYQRPFALIYFDLDGFKEVNDRWGHESGDALLRQAAKCLRNTMRREDMLARVGGDEFLGLLPDTGPSDAANLVIRLHTHFTSQKFESVSGEPITGISFSAGVSYFPEEGDIRERLVAIADKNMYSHKAAKADDQ
ncbi:MAG: GGDEF domain-containing protein [Planctomycetota bacterium]|nr:GGDEF domain-containing protein [Planctomycetota bacterium]